MKYFHHNLGIGRIYLFIVCFIEAVHCIEVDELSADTGRWPWWLWPSAHYNRYNYSFLASMGLYLLGRNNQHNLTNLTTSNSNSFISKIYYEQINKLQTTTTTTHIELCVVNECSYLFSRLQTNTKTQTLAQSTINGISIPVTMEIIKMRGTFGCVHSSRQFMTEVTP